MVERVLPQEIRDKASISVQGEYAWRGDDVEEVVAAAAAVGLACLGGQVQFRLPDGTYEAYWLDYDSTDRLAGEAWTAYVQRCAGEVVSGFRRVYDALDVRKEALNFASLRDRVQRGEIDLDRWLWFVLYFEADTTE